MFNKKLSVNKSLKLNLLYRVVVLFQILSLIYSYTTGFLTGDYISYEFKNSFNLILAFIFCLLPFYIIKTLLTKKKFVDNNVSSFNDIDSFKYVCAVLLVLNILFSFFFNVGKSATDIYSAPILLKPIIVVVNRININILAGFLLLSSRVTFKFKIFVLIGIITLALSRASISIFLYLFLLFLIKNGNSKKPNNVFLYTMIIACFGLLILWLGPALYQFRDAYRSGNTEINYSDILESTNYFDFIFGKIIGRISNISSFVFFVENINLMKSTVYKLDYFSYFIEYFKPIWGSFVDYKFNSYTYYFTNLFDVYAENDYGIMYGLPSVLILSYLSLPVLPFFIILLIIVTVILIILISKRLFGNLFREFSLILLFFPLTSGVAPEFFQILIDLFILYLLKTILLSHKPINLK